jgi:hypothetical protein
MRPQAKGRNSRRPSGALRRRREGTGCEQFEVFQSVLNPDKLALLELWSDQAALDVHAKVNLTRAPMPPGLRAEGSSREEYQYNRTR